jgi:import inner membrane translocase subunit TIM50
MFATLVVVVGGGAYQLGAAQRTPADAAENKYAQLEAGTMSEIFLAGMYGVLHFFLSFLPSVNELVFGEQTILLPQQVPDPFGRPVMTVCINFEKTMVHTTWTRDYGWLVYKRPYVDMLLEKLARAGVEVVLFSDSPTFDIDTHVLELDKLGALRHKLYRDATNFNNGKVVKDLSRLGRDLSQVVLLDHNWKEASCLQPANCVHLSPYEGALDDKELFRVLHFLEMCQKYNVQDVRDFIPKFNAAPNTDHFVDARKRAEEYTQQLADLEGSVSTDKKKQGMGGWSSALFGKK